MNARPEISGQNLFSLISSFSSSYSEPRSRGSSSPGDFHTRDLDSRPSTSGLELAHVAKEEEEEEASQHKNGFGTTGRKPPFRMIYVCTMASMFCALCAGFATLYSGPATFDMETRKNSRIKVTSDEVSWIGSTLNIGMVVTIPLSVYLSDRIGRKETLIFNTIPFVISWLVIIYAPNALLVMVGRFFAGWASGVIFAVLPMYAVEIASADTRGLIGASFQACITIGSLIAMGLGAILNWAWLAVAGLILVVVTLIVFCPMPESPRWLVANGMKQEAIRAILFLHADKVDAVKECQIIEESLKIKTSSKFSIQNLRQPIIYKPTLISMVQMVIVPFTGASPILLFSSEIFEYKNNIVDAKSSTAILGGVQAIATIISSLIMDKAGRRVLLLTSGFFMGISLAIVGAYFYISSYDSSFSAKAGWVPLVFLICHIAMFSIGYGPIPWLMLAEMIPTRERAVVSGVVTFLLSTVAFGCIKTFEDLRDAIHYYGIFWMYSAVCFLSCVFVYFVVPETKGKQLEEIQNIFRGQQLLAVADDDDDDTWDSATYSISNPAVSKT